VWTVDKLRVSSYSMTLAPTRIGFEAMRSGAVDCTLVHFGELWPTYQKCSRPAKLSTSASVITGVRRVPRPLFGLSRVATVGVMA
jgi:hypothetical protein